MICLVRSLIVDLLVSTSPSGHDALRYCCAGIIQWTMPASLDNAYACRKYYPRRDFCVYWAVSWRFTV